MAMVPIDDMGETLSGIVHGHGKSILTQLLEIQSCRIKEPQSVAFIRKLECFEYVPNSNRKRRRSDGSTRPRGFLNRQEINAYDERKYIALSYTWEPSMDEVKTKGGYMVERRDRSQYDPSTVRDCIFSRITKYMMHNEIKFLWIDRHSVHQRDIKKKQIGVQAMHLVYAYSQHPVAMLARRVKSSDELDLLYKLLEGQLVQGIGTAVAGPNQRPPVLSKSTSRKEALKTLQMLGEMMRDKWWTRAWTFQECYRAGVSMTLLIPLHAPLNRQKQRCTLFREVFGDVPGELCVNAVKLSDQATRLCQALQEVLRGTLSEDEIEMIQHIRRTAGKYTQLLQVSDPMFPTIIADIAKRGIKDPWDRLAIAANCCYYPTRLDVLKLKHESCSLSLSTISLCLLNGEILNNGKDREPTQDLLGCTVSQYLQKGFYHRFRSPFEERNLTFNKGCRFPDVTLTREGIKTKGHLWELGPFIDRSMFHHLPSLDEDRCVWLKPEEHRRLRQLASFLQRKSLTTSLSNHVERLLDVECETDFEELNFSKQYQLRMAVELMSVVDNGGKLRLGALWDPSKSSAKATPYSALFAWDRNLDGSLEEEAERELPGFVFTAMSPVRPETTEQRAKDVDRHVSLEVEVENLPQVLSTDIPRLYVKNWLLGLCFFYGCERQRVVFPWSSELEKLEG